ncbi:GDYXXLXY domain-containing protein [Parvibaculum sp.]|jgi:uncharacterized membrane-anchored protein|uniref:GDYXXLXY domain-containing protein n=1 Tax=Parvibaculum sp. TaxID=2024848 RepID=UPI0025F90C6B|nr:GDYXXLXY domain-containing protein [Parvibaculum sp.]|tara:strand:+ start:33795 stop:34397 length:603 start_codon:yes stop_codon:yes gene_type:complete
MNRFGLAVIALVIGQSLFLAAMVWDRVSLLRSDTVVTLETAPVDPRDIFRGDYVILNYAISRLHLDALEGDDEFSSGDEIYVELAPDGATWKAVAVWRGAREPRPGNAIIRGHVSYVLAQAPATETSGTDGNSIPCPNCGSAFVTYGIESYFVPEGEGRVLEDQRNAGDLTIDVALGDNGTAAIKQLRLNGEPVYEEPLF